MERCRTPTSVVLKAVLVHERSVVWGSGQLLVCTCIYSGSGWLLVHRYKVGVVGCWCKVGVVSCW